MAKQYRTNKGKPIDMEAMRTANAKTIAAGNMSVNANGDIVQGGKVIKTAKERAQSRYQGTTQVKQASLKKAMTQKDGQTTPEVKPEPTPIPDAEITTETIRQRDDGSKYAEIMTPDGDIEIKELSAPTEKPEKASKKKSKKTASKKKKPTV
jgi:hypothetical protein